MNTDRGRERGRAGQQKVGIENEMNKKIKQ